MFRRIKKRYLLSRLKCPNPRASAAADSLVKLDDKSIIPTLLDRLTSVDVGNEVWLAILILGKIGDQSTPRAILDRLQVGARLYPPLVEAFENLHATAGEWFELLSAVSRDTSYFGTIDHHPERYRIEAIKRLGMLGSIAAPILDELAGDRLRPGSGDRSRNVRKAARDVLSVFPERKQATMQQGSYTDEEIQFIIGSITAWEIARHDNRYSPRLYDDSGMFRPKLTVINIRRMSKSRERGCAHFGKTGIAKAISVVATKQWIKLMSNHPEAGIARSFVYEPYLQGEARELIRERESSAP